MHELSIAHSLTQMATAALQEEDVEQVEAVHLKLGALSGIIKDALLFSYDIAVKGTILEGSKLIIEEVPVIVHCVQCGDVELPHIQSFRCPQCNALSADIRQGKEVEITSIAYQEASPHIGPLDGPVDAFETCYDKALRN